MRIFITGGTGFVGKWVVPLLASQGHDVLTLTRQPLDWGTPGVTYLVGDLRDVESIRRSLKNFRPDAFVHLAWEGLPDYSYEMCWLNFEHSLRLFTLARDVGCSCLLSTGSCWEYTSRMGQLSEEAALGFPSVFPSVKNALRFAGEAVSQAVDLQFYWLRLFFVYGPGQRSNSLIPHIIDSVKNGTQPQIKALNNRNDFVYVEDVARAIADVLTQRPTHMTYNVGTGQPTAVKDIVQMTYDALGCTNETSSIDAPEPDQDFWADISRIQADLSWQPQWDIVAGIESMVRERKE